jgi:hypothetical protein
MYTLSVAVCIVRDETNPAFMHEMYGNVKK